MKRFFIFLVLLIVILLAGYFYFQQKGGVQDITLERIDGLRFEGISTFPHFSLSTKANAVLNNPNPFGVEIKKLEFDVYINDKQTSKVNQLISVPMPAASNFDFPFKFEIPLGKAGFLKDAKDILTGAWKEKSFKIRTVGNIEVEVLNIPLKLPFDEEEVYLLGEYLE